ncbi:MAG TPA: ATP-binding protein [Polyangiaceae bacterium]
MGRDRWEREREALRKLARVFAEETRGGLLEEALEAVLAASRIGSGAAFAMDRESLDLVAERWTSSSPSDRTTHPSSRERCKQALVAAAGRAAKMRRLVFLPDVGRSDLEAEHREALQSSGFHALAAQPVKHQRDVLGVLVILSKDPTSLDGSVAAFLETVAHVVALAAERDRRVERELGYRAELAEAGHMAALGLLTATVAHELRGPVAALGVQLAEQQQIVEQLRDEGSDWAHKMLSEMTELLEDMRAAAGQVSTVISQLSALSRRDTAPDRLELGAVAREGLGIARSALKGRGISLVEDYAGGCYTLGRRDNLVQVVLNLVFNAADACATSKRANPKVIVQTRVEGPRIVLSIDDTGPGVPESDIHAIFQPFFTTKERGRGTGLGLKICSDVVAAHHGHIEVVNLSGGGASFRVILPKLITTGISSSSREIPTAPPPVSERMEVRRVFVVDDDELFTRTVRRALKPHDVRTASTASEAEMMLLAPEYEPDLVLCDLGLPGMTGDILHARIASKRPKVAERFLFVTGGACSKSEADYLRASGCATLLKPIDVKDIWTALSTPPPKRSAAPDSVATLRSDAPPPLRSEVPTVPPGPINRQANSK